MQTVGAQWLLVDKPNTAALVALVQVANTVPVMLLALPGGVLADSFDRRRLLFTVQVYFLLVGLLLVGLTVAGQMPAGLLLLCAGRWHGGAAAGLAGTHSCPAAPTQCEGRDAADIVRHRPAPHHSPTRVTRPFSLRHAGRASTMGQ